MLLLPYMREEVGLKIRWHVCRRLCRLLIMQGIPYTPTPGSKSTTWSRMDGEKYTLLPDDRSVAGVQAMVEAGCAWLCLSDATGKR